MALKKCPDCGKMVSDSAKSCPNCGRPMSTATSACAKVKGAVTIQKTGKGIKGCGCLSVLLIFIGICIAYACGQQESITGEATPPGLIVAYIVIGVGIFGLVGSRIAKWWFHD